MNDKRNNSGDAGLVDDKMAEARERMGRMRSEAASGVGKPPVTERSEEALRKASQELKEEIIEAKRRNNMPLDSALGNPEWERGASDGHLDAPKDEDD